jgi:hypothetical protein
MLLLVVGALIGFRGWPGDASVGDAGGIAIQDTRLTHLPTVELQGAAPRADAPSAAAARPLGARKARRSRAGKSQDAGDVGGVRRDSADKASPAGGGAVGGRSVGSTSEQPRVKSVTEGVAKTVNQVTETAGGGLGGNSNPVGKVVIDTGNAVSKTVQQLGVDAQGTAKQP